ncbi:uncharacterized protein HMPREF1541_06935 [Cyphellophora europaea CBS 101466]|uniref:RING-type domain-containing protein n=1 Tax=Cyphellophora europaea (strain CBS 101466) TaxID=1220924 RepID=W2RT38_CYPE1|nr:uncharacterized protein HMPREF1541_06935 [Cyphellophora europaea CBS 101466]ETN38893.1 hypothetical protein HMPREF1541_06935 [Cyphellophora europaea CBS 101466]
MDTDGPQSKRRKLSNSDDVAASHYLPLARTTVEVSLVPVKKPSPIPFDEEIAIKTVRRTADGGLELVVNKGTPRSASTWTFTTSSPTNAHTHQILEDAPNMLPKAKMSGGHYLQACHNATLYQRDSIIELKVELLWCNTTSLWDKVDEALRDILDTYLPLGDENEPVEEAWQPREFYDNVHVPPKDSTDSAAIKIDGFLTNLYPFQRRTLRWMLRREGVTVDSEGCIEPVESEPGLPPGFVQVRGLDDQILYINRALATISSNYNEVVKAFQTPRGGLLADEMGLGKTLAVVGTVCCHRRPLVPALARGNNPRTSGATLIITPPTLLDQWREEIGEHTSSLRVVNYEGMKSSKRSFEDLMDDLAASDIVLTTYNVISREVHYVKEKPDRALRNKARTDTPKSPLTEISWWRVCLDEAQMVESGVSNAATVARLVPREIAWAVTGTPLRKAHRDLYGIMIFLRYQPWGWSPKLWDRLVDFHRPLFRSLISEIAIRHTKDYVREDLRLPPQNRHTITLPFTAVEEQHYENMFDEMCNAVNLRIDGSPRRDDWDPDDPKIVEEMRKWLSRLRQTCLHPEVGARNRRALGRGGGPLRTVGQVLDVMIDQTEGNLRTEQRALLMSQIRRGQMLENSKATKDALAVWQNSYKEATIIVDECRKRLEAEIEYQKQEKAKNERKAEESNDPDEEDELDANIQTFRQRLRSALEVQHICIFFVGNAFYQLKSKEDEVKPDSEEFYALEKQETEAYDEAKKIRGELLAEVLTKANKLINSVRTKRSDDTPEALTPMKPHDEYTGIESRKICEKLYNYCEAMNEQGVYFHELRQKMIDFLRQALIDDDAGVELQGDEYETSTKHQDEMYVYMEALRVLFADRSDAITGLENQLIKHEVRGFIRNAKEGEGPAPELMLKLLAERSQVHIDTEQIGSLRGIVAEARHLVTMLQVQEAAGSARARAELAVTEKLLSYSQQLATTRSRTLAQLEQEVNLFRDTMNSRLDYYRALQKISDTVAPYEEERIGEPLDQQVFDDTINGERAVSDKISTLASKRRYLIHLKDESTSSAPRVCTICQTEFEVGTLTVCGHQFCKECIQLWWHESKNCPVCKRRLYLHDFHDITYKPAEMAVQAESPESSNSSASSPESPRSQSIYTDLSTKTVNEIKNMDLHGPSFGSKVDMLIRHILWLREHDYGTKCIVFSQYHDFLDVLARAFKQHGISATAFDDKNGIQRFKVDPAIECFLLHAKAHSAGLNLVCASHVFLCEPLLATAVELQAIARVHRIGQHQATTVWMYIIAGTIEESIYEMSFARRLEHIKRNVKKVGKSKAGSSATSGTVTPKLLGETVIDQANSLELQEADLKKLLTTGKKGGEFVDKADLWQCLFGRRKVKETVFGGGGAGGKLDGEMGRLLRANAAEARID